MNASAETVESPDLQQQLRAAHARRAEARRKLVSLDGRLAVASASVEAAQYDFDTRTDEKAKWLERRSHQIENWWQSGHAGAPPSVVPDIGAETKLVTAEHTLKASRAALDALKAQREIARAELQTADAQVAAIAEQVLDAQDEVVAEVIIDMTAELLSQGQRLRVRQQGTHTPVNELRRTPRRIAARIEQALEIVQRLRLGCDLHTPANILAGAVDDLAEERAQLAARRSALLEGIESSEEVGA